MKLETALYKALVSANVSEDNATAVLNALEEEMSTTLATKNDMALLRTEIVALELKLTIRMGLMLSAFAGIVLGGMKYLI
ncbi:hypothetical protein [Pseudomonas gingeri]|uniref:hypothetical protein n=1 Tax=Pseudomonas gingeri TaxID=117681 RepID=UPI00159F9AB0|nr:hypothetical protein [Pseudomonas gingeri]NWA05379.1 hypothetical protein [Pseudomonas gingeri]NWA17802.1 hypothetical protein [Pseudomonas gingeri]NWA57766.1 hypothetical protein [Pseudomonas gingeri]NWA98787.1 hypothetical protein [Pseudomonas gingeri]NWB05913.1 hypothetical protein [Pseudomonas gingeri]